MIDFIQTYSDQIVSAIFLMIALALLLFRPKVSCCRQHRWQHAAWSPQQCSQDQAHEPAAHH